MQGRIVHITTVSSVFLALHVRLTTSLIMVIYHVCKVVVVVAVGVVVVVVMG